MIFINIIDPISKALGYEWLNDLSLANIILKLILAILCGGIIGFERAKKHSAAGFRTYILVCLGATVAMLTNEFICMKTGTGDGARLGAQVISGIGFLGAGTILVTSRNQIKGLTTAAGLWACACLGLAIGVGFFTLAILGSAIIMIVLSILPKIEDIFYSKSNTITIHIEFQCRANLKEFVAYVRGQSFKIYSIEHNPAYSSSGLSVYSIVLYNLDKSRKLKHTAYLTQFSSLEYVNYVEEIK